MKLSDKDIRALKLGAIAVIAIAVFVVGTKWWDHWDQARTEGKVLETKLGDIDMGETKRKGLMAIVPAFKMPVEEVQQEFLFRDAFDNQLNKAGIKNEPLKTVLKPKSPMAGYKSLHLTCTAKCKFSQVLDLLSRLNENPYLAGVEEFKLKIDPKKRSEVELTMTVSTFTRTPARTGRL